MEGSEGETLNQRTNQKALRGMQPWGPYGHGMGCSQHTGCLAVIDVLVV